MEQRIPAIVFGGLLLLVGGIMLFVQRRSRSELLRLDASPEDHRFLARRVRRRTQVAGLIVLIGFMIPIGDSLIPWRQAPGTFGVYWTIVIALAVWTAILAMGDIASTRAHMATELNRLHRHKLELRTIARKLKQAPNDGNSDN